MVKGGFPLAGLQVEGFTCPRTRPLRVVHVHGTKDDVVRYPGGSLTLDGHTFPSHSSVYDSFGTYLEPVKVPEQ